ncbi:hypothetical protein ASE74_07455 [Pedobacter sp. Leaf216]|nr:hypothetical protein ASE74_07455 [Pedobacter sp. Leaf216]
MLPLSLRTKITNPKPPETIFHFDKNPSKMKRFLAQNNHQKNHKNLKNNNLNNTPIHWHSYCKQAKQLLSM